jgi:hypothetical protein
MFSSFGSALWVLGLEADEQKPTVSKKFVLARLKNKARCPAVVVRHCTIESLFRQHQNRI